MRLSADWQRNRLGAVVRGSRYGEFCFPTNVAGQRPVLRPQVARRPRPHLPRGPFHVRGGRAEPLRHLPRPAPRGELELRRADLPRREPVRLQRPLRLRADDVPLLKERTPGRDGGGERGGGGAVRPAARARVALPARGSGGGGAVRPRGARPGSMPPPGSATPPSSCAWTARPSSPTRCSRTRASPLPFAGPPRLVPPGVPLEALPAAAVRAALPRPLRPHGPGHRAGAGARAACRFVVPRGMGALVRAAGAAGRGAGLVGVGGGRRACACIACPRSTSRAAACSTATAGYGRASWSKARRAASTTPATPAPSPASRRSGGASAPCTWPRCPSAPTCRAR